VGSGATLPFAPYLVAALVAWLLSHRRVRRVLSARVALVALVMLGTVAIPLGLEAHWRHSATRSRGYCPFATSVAKVRTRTARTCTTVT